LHWSKFYSLENLSTLPAGKFVFSICLPEDLFFALVNARGVRTYWLGVLSSSTLGRRHGKELVVRFYLQHHRGFTVSVITRILYMGIANSLKKEVPTLLTHNPCLKHLLSDGIKLGIAVRPVLNVEDGKAEIEKFLSETCGFCFPASCGCGLCEELGGISVPTFIGRKEIC